MAAMGNIRGKEKAAVKGQETVRLKKGGKRFEVVCFSGKAAEFRAGKESNVSAVLVISRVYTNATKGQFATKEELAPLFEATKDKAASDETLAIYVVQNGELQSNEEDRQKQKAADTDVLKAVAEIISAKVFDPTPKSKKEGKVDKLKDQKYTPADIEREIKNLRLEMTDKIPPKVLALEVISQLKLAGSFPVVRVQQHVKVTPTDPEKFRDGLAAHRGYVHLWDEDETSFNVLMDPEVKAAVEKLAGGQDKVQVVSPHFLPAEGQPDLTVGSFDPSDKKDKKGDAGKAGKGKDKAGKPKGKEKGGKDSDSDDALGKKLNTLMTISDDDGDDDDGKKGKAKKGKKKATPAPAAPAAAKGGKTQAKKPWEHSDDENEETPPASSTKGNQKAANDSADQDGSVQTKKSKKKKGKKDPQDEDSD